MSKVVLILGSGSDLEFSKPILEALSIFGVERDLRIASAHKTPKRLLRIMEEYEKSEHNIVYITVAGRSNALSGFVDANTVHPVIACPPYSEKFGGVDIYSTLRMPSGVCPMAILEPEGAALGAVKILASASPGLREVVRRRQTEVKKKVEEADERLGTRKERA